MPSSLQERVRLCDRAQAEFDAVLPELVTAIRDHTRHVRAVALETLPKASPATKGNGRRMELCQQELISRKTPLSSWNVYKETNQLLGERVARLRKRSKAAA